MATFQLAVGVAVIPLKAASTPCQGFLVQAHPDNTAVVWIGGSNVSASGKVGIRIEVPVASSPLPYFSASNPAGIAPINLNNWYVVAGSASQFVNVVYVGGA
jgi:hypothetical protein